MGAPEVPPWCRETQSLGQQMLNAPLGINGLSCVRFLWYSPVKPPKKRAIEDWVEAGFYAKILTAANHMQPNFDLFSRYHNSWYYFITKIFMYLNVHLSTPKMLNILFKIMLISQKLIQVYLPQLLSYTILLPYV